MSVTNPNLDFEENSPHQEGIISEMYVSPDQSYIEEMQELVDLGDTSKLVQIYLPKQTDIDKILDVIKRKVLRGTHLPLTIKEVQAGYLTSLFLRTYTDFWFTINCQVKRVPYASRNFFRKVYLIRFPTI